MSKEQFDSLSKENKELYTRLVNEFSEREAKIKSYLLASTINRRYVDENGVEYEIKDIVNGNPIYYATDNSAAATATKTNQLQVGGSLGLDLDGSGMTLGIWDGGAVENTHPEFAPNILSSRVTVIDAETPGGISFSNHGTHVAGTLGASGVNSAAKGMATNVDIKSYGWTNDYAEMLSAATDLTNPIYLSNHSYGVPTSTYVTTGEVWVMGAYTSASRTIDELVYNNPKYLPVLSAGNAGNVTHSGQSFAGLDKLTGDKTAKNNLVIANANPTVNGSGELTNLVINSGSSQGPADDFRIKPDLAGDGTNLFSTFPGSGYGTLSGTSMAAPNVTGSLVLLQQYYSQLNSGAFMDASTVKAIVCHTAIDDNANVGPDPIFGWGFLDAKASAEIISGADNGNVVLNELTLENNETYSFVFTANAGEKLSATICWTDLPGTISNGTLNDPTAALVNDLDLRISKDGTTYLPWRLSTSLIGGIGNSKGDNAVDTVERIDIEIPTAGEYTLSVSHKGTLQGTTGDQKYSLVVTGNNLALSTNDLELEGIKVSPNPFSESITLSLPSSLANQRFNIFITDINGRVVLNQTNESNNGEITISNLNNLNNALYFLNIESITSNSRITKKIIKL
jgi:hypothetical protein